MKFDELHRYDRTNCEQQRKQKKKTKTIPQILFAGKLVDTTYECKLVFSTKTNKFQSMLEIYIKTARVLAFSSFSLHPNVHDFVALCMCCNFLSSSDTYTILVLSFRYLVHLSLGVSGVKNTAADTNTDIHAYGQERRKSKHNLCVYMQ